MKSIIAQRAPFRCRWTPRATGTTVGPMQPADITAFAQELAIRWEDGREDFIPLESLRRFCPCAACLGEQDIFGKTYRPPQRPYSAESFELRKLPRVGNYAIQPLWGDGHATGLYTWEWLRRISDAVKSPETESE